MGPERKRAIDQVSPNFLIWAGLASIAIGGLMIFAAYAQKGSAPVDGIRMSEGVVLGLFLLIAGIVAKIRRRKRQE